MIVLVMPGHGESRNALLNYTGNKDLCALEVVRIY